MWCKNCHADISKQQAAISAVKIIMQATGEITMSEMTRAATTSFTSKTKQLVKSLTGSDAEDNGGDDNSGEGGENTNGSNNTNGGGTGSITPSGDDTGGSGTGGGDNGGGGNLPGGDDH